MQPIVSDTGYRHILMMSDGRAMIAGTRLKVEYIVKYTHQGVTPEEICEAYEHNNLTLGQVHSALAYYYDNKGLVDELIEEGERYIEELDRQGFFYKPDRAELLRRWEEKKAREAREAEEAAAGPS